MKTTGCLSTRVLLHFRRRAYIKTLKFHRRNTRKLKAIMNIYNEFQQYTINWRLQITIKISFLFKTRKKFVTVFCVQQASWVQTVALCMQFIEMFLEIHTVLQELSVTSVTRSHFVIQDHIWHWKSEVTEISSSKNM